MALGDQRGRSPGGQREGTPQVLGPEEVARRRFSNSFRGFDPNEVRGFLAQVADELARLRARQEELRVALEEARQAPTPTLDRETLMAALGEETSRIVTTAEEAAEDIRAKAEEAAARLRAGSSEEALALRSEAEVVLGRRTEEAEAAATDRARRAEEEAQALLADAAWRAQEIVREAEATRDQVLADLSERRRVAHLQVERLGAGRDRLLEAYALVRRNLDEAVVTLDSAPDDARRAAEAAESAARRRPPAEHEPAPAPASEPPVADVAPEPDPEPELAPAPEPEPEPEPEPAPVIDLFARIRAERAAATPTPANRPQLGSDSASEMRPVREGESHLEARDAELDPLVGPLVRKLKRSLQDEQNEVLDRIRGLRRAATLEDALGSEVEQSARFEVVVLEALDAAAAAGAKSAGGSPAPNRDKTATSGLTHELVGSLRRGIGRVLEVADGDEQAVAEGLSGAYREWRSARLEHVAAEHLSAAFAGGVFDAGAGASLQWVVDDGADPCPDCDDNALAGPTRHGDAFPTGQVRPPAHPGCRCLLVVVAP